MSKNGQYIVTLPKALVHAKGWDKGTEFNIRFNERGNIELEEVKK